MDKNQNDSINHINEIKSISETNYKDDKRKSNDNKKKINKEMINNSDVKILEKSKSILEGKSKSKRTIIDLNNPPPKSEKKDNNKNNNSKNQKEIIKEKSEIKHHDDKNNNINDIKNK